MATERYFVGPRLLTDIRDTISRVQGMPDNQGGGFLPGMYIPLTPPLGEGGAFRVATFTGAWSIASTKEVTFKYETNTPNTASVLNLFFDFPEPQGTIDCGIAQDGTAWHLVSVPIESVNQQLRDGGDYDNVEVVTDVGISATLSTADCSITVGKTLTTQTVLLPVGGSTYTANVLIFKVN